MSEYLVLARESSEMLAHGYVSDPVPRPNSAYGNPDVFGDAWQWLTRSAATIGKYLPGPLGQVLPPIATAVGKVKGQKPFDVLAGIGETAMDSPLGDVLVGIGEAAVGWDPEAWIRETWKRGELKDIRTDGKNGGNGGDNGDRDVDYTTGNGKWGIQPCPVCGNYPCTCGTTTTTTEGPDGTTTIHNYYYYDQQDEQAVKQASDDGVMGSIMDIFLLFMIMMPMMQGFGGLGQAQPQQQSNAPGWFY